MIGRLLCLAGFHHTRLTVHTFDTPCCSWLLQACIRTNCPYVHSDHAKGWRL